MSDDDGVGLPLSDEDRAYRASLEKLVDWVRIEQAPVLWWAFLPGGIVLVPLGGALVGAALSGVWVNASYRPLVTALGLLLIASGPAWALSSLIRSMREDLYVAIRVDGLAVRLDPRRVEDLHTWEAIEDVRYDEGSRAVQVELRSGRVIALRGPFAGKSERELTERIKDARRLAVWQRLRPETWR